jgi:anti-sigma B factor antagonist
MTQHVELEKKTGYSIVSFKDLKNIDANSALRVKAEISGLLDEDTCFLIIDLEGVRFIDSTGFGMLISVLKVITGRKGRLILCGVSDDVRELMDLMQLLSVFEIKPSLKEAAASFN